MTLLALGDFKEVDYVVLATEVWNGELASGTHSVPIQASS